MTPKTPITVGHVGWSPDYKSTPSPSATCSASSETPETDTLANEIYDRGIRVSEIRMLEHARKMEHQRNAAWKTLKEIRELFAADESFGSMVEALFSKPLEEAEAEIARLQSLLNH